MLFLLVHPCCWSSSLIPFILCIVPRLFQSVSCFLVSRLVDRTVGVVVLARCLIFLLLLQKLKNKQDTESTYSKEAIQSPKRPSPQQIARHAGQGSQHLPSPQITRDNTSRHQQDMQRSCNNRSGLSEFGHEFEHEEGKKSLILDFICLFFCGG